MRCSEFTKNNRSAKLLSVERTLWRWEDAVNVSVTAGSGVSPQRAQLKARAAEPGNRSRSPAGRWAGEIRDGTRGSSGGGADNTLTFRLGWDRTDGEGDGWEGRAHTARVRSITPESVKSVKSGAQKFSIIGISLLPRC